jgi:hypothetical protein
MNRYFTDIFGHLGVAWAPNVHSQIHGQIGNVCSLNPTIHQSEKKTFFYYYFSFQQIYPVRQ